MPPLGFVGIKFPDDFLPVESLLDDDVLMIYSTNVNKLRSVKISELPFGTDEAAVISIVNTNETINAYNAARLGGELPSYYTDLINSKYDKTGGTISGDVTISGNLTVLGTEFVQTVQIEDNLAIINYGETGAGITAGFAGWEADRGTLNNYRWGYDESRDLWVLGEVGTTLQAVATREDSPLDKGFTFWNNTTKRFETTNAFEIDESGNLHVYGNILAQGGITAYSTGSLGDIWDNMPAATSSSIGGVIVGSGLTVVDGVISVSGSFSPTSHNLLTSHTVSGLTAGTFLKALSATTFGFAEHGLTYTDVGAAAASHNHTGVYEPAFTKLSAGKGGTGQNTLAANKILVGNGTNGILSPSALTWDSVNNYLGISATSPQARIHCAAAGSNQLYLQQYSTGVGDFSEILFGISTATYYHAAIRTERRTAIAGDLVFLTQNTSANYADLSERMRITYAGDVGIGTSPSYKLDVNGTGRFTGHLYANSNIYLGGTQYLPNGSAANPSIRFSNDVDTGIFLVEEGVIGITIGGTLVCKISAAGIVTTGGITAQSTF